jgi:hypothetical protein
MLPSLKAKDTRAIHCGSVRATWTFLDTQVAHARSRRRSVREVSGVMRRPGVTSRPVWPTPMVRVPLVSRYATSRSPSTLMMKSRRRVVI